MIHKLIAMITFSLALSACVTDEERAAQNAAAKARFEASRTPEAISALRPVIQTCVNAVLTGQSPSQNVGSSIGASVEMWRKPVVNLGGVTRTCQINIPNSGPNVQFAGDLITEIAQSRGFSSVSRKRGTLVFSNGTNRLEFSSLLQAGPKGRQTLYVQLF